MTKYKISKFKLEDRNLEHLVELNLRFSKETKGINENPIRIKLDLENGLKNNRYDCFLAKKDNKTVGYSLWTYEPKYHKGFNKAYILDQYVLPEHRGNLIGLNLLSLTIEHLKSIECEKCFIGVPNNKTRLLQRITRFFKFDPIKEEHGYVTFSRKL